MIKIANQIFQESGFSNSKLNLSSNEFSFEFWTNDNIDFVNYYLVIYLKELPDNFLTEKIAMYFEKIKTMTDGYNKQMDKNLSLIIFFDETKNKLRDEEIFKIEEDPYFFKKYVITYNSTSYKYLENNLNDFVGTVEEFINSVINDTRKFVNFKLKDDSVENLDLYELCSKLIIKLPFINLLSRTEKFSNLTETIDQILEENNVYELKERILKMNIEKFSFQKYLELIEKNMESENIE